MLILFVVLCTYTNAHEYPQSWIKLTKGANKSNYTEIEKDFAKLVKKNSKNPYAFYERALFYYKFHKDDLAIQDVSRAIEIMPSKYSFYIFRAELYLASDRDAEALQDINMMFLMDGTIPDPYVLKAQYYFQNDSLQAAYSNFSKAITIYENNNAPCYIMSRCYSGRGRLNFAFGNIDAAISDFTKAISKAKDTKRDNLYMLRANAYLYKNDTQNAFQDIGSALMIMPDSLTLGYIYALKGNKEKVEEIIPAIISKKVISTCCKEGANMYNIACFYGILNNKEKSLNFLEKSLQAGYDKFNWIQTDFDMRNIKHLPEFASLIKKYQTDKQK
ncbi:MAG: hypothetical protein IT271_10915 [Chitinophagales bacterium]|nr:hypothetical protein [Chitinophagales bacterium]